MTESPRLDFDIGTFGPGVIWQGEIDAKLIERLERVGAREVSLFPSRGQPVGSLEALADQPLVGVSIHPGRSLGKADWEVIQGWPLRYLRHEGGRSSGRLDLGELSDLEWLSSPWWKGLSWAGSDALRGLSLRGWKPDGGALAELPERLRVLELAGGALADGLSGIERLQQLECLLLTGVKQLERLDGAEGLGALRECALHTLVELEDVSALAGCARLERLHIEGCARLARIDLAGAESLDGLWLIGNLSGMQAAPDWIANHPTLRHVALTDDVPGDRAAWARSCGEPAYGTPPSFDYREPRVADYRAIISHPIARRFLYPAWLRERHPELCPD